jgi:uncharacterized membrane protein YhhN
MVVALSLLTVVAVAALVWAERSDVRAARWAAKAAASVGFVAVALAGGALEARFGRAVALALVLSLAGDLLLIPPSVTAFRLGLFSFLLAHLAFAASFVVRGVDGRAAAGAAVVLGLLALAIARWLLPHVRGRMRRPVIAYICAIVSMVSLAAGSVAAHGRPVLLAAAACFFVSDLSVARDRFVAPGFVNRLWGLPLYYFAQLLFAWSV